MQQKIIAFLKQHRMIEKNDHVIVACSGGADSVCLLLVLCAIRKELGFSLSAVHVEHGIRGEESRRDAAFTEELCKRLSIPLAVCPVDAPAYAAGHRMGIEEAARTLRYDVLREQAADREETVRIALAHHMEDNAETMLFSLARGSGLAGLGGIAPVRKEGKLCFIRPLLCVTRGEIEAYLAELGQPYCTDRTNLDETYTRNRIRRSILPQLTLVNAQAVQHMNRSAEKISQAYDFIREYAEIKYREISVRIQDGDVPPEAQTAEKELQTKAQTAKSETQGGQRHIALRASGLCALHPAIRQEVLRMTLFEAAGHRKDIASVHVEELEGLLKLQSGRRIALPYGLVAFLEYDTVHICPECGADKELLGQQTSQVPVEALRAFAGNRDTGTDAPRCGAGAQTPGTGSAHTCAGEQTPDTGSAHTCAGEQTPDTGSAYTCISAAEQWPYARENAPWVLLWEDGTGAGLRARVWKTMSPLEEITKKAYTKQFDYDKINSGFLVRKRQKGDYFVLDQDGHRKKLSDYMINEKIPARLRDRIPLLAKESEVIWLVGGRISATVKVTKDTTHIMEIEYYGGMSDGLS
jgi:tRNA(Ile)-lysidine synthase